ncbi:FecR domain-containing protein [Rhodopseudomonas sp. NSM]|uniref:FecR domain-containing protein n=1 Tax=Rhodopseudomonas sp. NSM TaxID=3457630 RepID=UPI0040373413
MLAVLAAMSMAAPVAHAQSVAAACTAESAANGAQTLRCPGGVVIVAEAGADFAVRDRDRNGVIDAVELRSKAVLIDAPKQRAGRRFEVITPQAIAAVRGTQWAVDVEAARSSVFVVSGRVGVRRRQGRDGVVLGRGEGVDVAAAGALTVRRWPQPRVDALLRRLGR